MNWKTTTLGTGAILTALGGLLTQAAKFDSFTQMLSNIDFSSITTGAAAILAGIGLIFSKDHDVSGGKRYRYGSHRWR